MAAQKIIKVLVIDDSRIFREIIAASISQDPWIEVVGTAADAFSANEKIASLMPDVITLDVEMPKINGIDFLKKLMPVCPIPAVVVSSNANNVLDALSAGAVDFVTKPIGENKNNANLFINELIVKIKIASVSRVGIIKRAVADVPKVLPNARLANKIIAIGASTGGTEAIYSVIKDLPVEMPGMVIVVHMPPVFTKMYADRLNGLCKLQVKEAENGDVIEPGKVLIAPGDFHMTVAGGGSKYVARCNKGEKVNGHCPSVDILFDSVAKIAGKNSIGVILTGMGNDGAKGLLNMKSKGAYTIGQDEKSSVVYGMPMVAFNIGAVQKQIPLVNIPDEIIRRAFSS